MLIPEANNSLTNDGVFVSSAISGLIFIPVSKCRYQGYSHFLGAEQSPRASNATHASAVEIASVCPSKACTMAKRKVRLSMSIHYSFIHSYNRNWHMSLSSVAKALRPIMTVLRLDDSLKSFSRLLAVKNQQ